jgi:hypothetical protein
MVLTGVSTVNEVVETGINPDVILETLDPLSDALLNRAGASGTR